MDARVSIATWLSMPGDRTNFWANAQTAFELGLRRDGLTVDPATPNYLICEILAAHRGGVVAYAWRVAYYRWTSQPGAVHTLLWQTGGIVTIGSPALSAQDSAKDCVDAFANEWLKQNPRR